jgi:5-methylcytosine-specific restriction endonuclease McrA
MLPLAQATVEHEPPRSRQKELGTSQTYIVCKTCNNEKGALTLDEYNQWKYLEFLRNGGKRKEKQK